uniref:Uncharacterized protein n=2 Tax=Oryza sativa subsp. japonica TaxID=39947 RepID=Q7G4K9_ORYSJ|nr:hypothetical protein [Oryza sativa Japonica Group]AAP52571.1 hypothetical protein LOC_Os10g11550 [Oryza sativa Japonica Group]
MDRGGVWMEGKRCRGRPCRCDARGGDGDVGRRTGTAEGAAGVGADKTEGEAARATAFRRNRGQAGVEGDAATSTKETATSADALTRRPGRLKAVQWRQRHCFAGEDASPVISPRNGGEAEEEEAAATSRMATARPAGTQAPRQGRPEMAVGTGERGR